MPTNLILDCILLFCACFFFNSMVKLYICIISLILNKFFAIKLKHKNLTTILTMWEKCRKYFFRIRKKFILHKSEVVIKKSISSSTKTNIHMIFVVVLYVFIYLLRKVGIKSIFFIFFFLSLSSEYE